MVLVSRLSSPALRALAYAAAVCPVHLEAVHVCTGEEVTQELREGWARYDPSRTADAAPPTHVLLGEPPALSR